MLHKSCLLLQPVFRIRDILVRIRIQGSILTDQDPALFVSDLQDISKKKFQMFLLITFCRYRDIILQR